MKTNKLVILATAVIGCASGSSHAQGLTLNFANLSSAAIQFNGSSDSFNFTSDGSGNQWDITSESAGYSSAVGFDGSVTGGPFNYGAITTSGSGAGEVQTATVTGPSGLLSISDGTLDLTGIINWVDVTTYGAAGAAGELNDSLTINLTDITYAGSNPDLGTLAYNHVGSVDLTFTFQPGQTLTQLSSGTGPYDTAYSGSIYAVPEPQPMALAALGGLGLLLYRRRK